MWSIIRYLPCGNFDRWSVQSTENLSGYRKDWYEKILWRTHGSHPWQFPDVSVLQCGLSVLWTQKEYDESPLFWPGWICTPAEAPGQWKIPMATQCFRSQTPDKAGIPLADGRTFHWPAESDTACERQGLLICAICRFWKIFLQPEQAVDGRYPQMWNHGVRCPGIVEHDIIMICITLRKIPETGWFWEKKELSGFRHNASLILDGICNHAPTKGATDPDDGDDNKDKFQSTLPRRERQDSQKDSQKDSQFQSTLPRRERLHPVYQNIM